MFSTKKNRLKKKILTGEVTIEKGLHSLWEEEPIHWKTYLEICDSFLAANENEKALITALKSCDYFVLRPEPFEKVAELLEKKKRGGGPYYVLAKEKHSLQNLDKEKEKKYPLGTSPKKISEHLKAHQLVQQLILCEDFCSPKLHHSLKEHSLVPTLLMLLISQANDFALRHHTWPLIHSINLLQGLRFKEACAPLVQLLDHPDSFLVEEAKNALHWVVTEHPDQLSWIMEIFKEKDHGPIKLQLLDLMTAFAEQEECYKFLQNLLVNFKKNHDAKYSTQYAHILIQRLIMHSNGSSIPAARSFFTKNKNWFTDRNLEKLFDVIDHMEGK